MQSHVDKRRRLYMFKVVFSLFTLAAFKFIVLQTMSRFEAMLRIRMYWPECFTHFRNHISVLMRQYIKVTK